MTKIAITLTDKQAELFNEIQAMLDTTAETPNAFTDADIVTLALIAFKTMNEIEPMTPIELALNAVIAEFVVDYSTK